MDNVYVIAAIWVGLALVASLISIRLGISVALIEIVVGVFGGNFLALSTTPWIDFLAMLGSVLLTFLAGAEIDPDSLRRHLRMSLTIGAVSFAAPAIAAFAVARWVIGWDLGAAEITGIAMSTTSVAVVYAVMIESGLAQREIGKIILAACFVTDLGTVLALGVLFADYDLSLVLFIAATAVALVTLPRLLRWVLATVPGRVSEPEIKLLLFVLLGLGGLASIAGSEAVLPAYLVGLVVAGVFVKDRVVVQRMRAIAFALLTPFFFIKAGMLISLPAVAAGAALIALLLAVKIGAKSVGVWPTARAFRMSSRDATFTTLLMATGLTFGSISALFGLNHGLIDQSQYSVLVTTVILSAVIPTLIATTFFSPTEHGAEDDEEIEAAEEIDAGSVRPHHAGTANARGDDDGLTFE